MTGRACSRTTATRAAAPPTPYRKLPGRPLTEVRKNRNRASNSLHAAIERAISHLLNRKILDLGYRGRLSESPDVLHTVTNHEIYQARA